MINKYFLSFPKNRINLLLLAVLLFQILIVAGICWDIYSKTRLLPKVSASPLDIGYLRFNEYYGLEGFYDLKPGIVNTNGGGWVHYPFKNTVNSDGLNERIDYSTSKPPGSFRIITLGDSFTFGQFVDTTENYPERLEDMLNFDNKCRENGNFEVVNLGVSGYDIKYATARFIKNGEKYQSDLVIWLLTKNNLLNIKEITQPELAGCLNKNGYDFSQPHGPGQNKIQLTCWNQTVSAAADRYSPEEIYDYQEKAFEEFLQHYSGKVLIITFASQSNQDKQFLKKITGKRDGIYYFSELDEAYIKSDLLPDRHPGSNGYALITKSIFELLNDKKLIPCN